MKTLFISGALIDDIRAAAVRAHPHECCGLIEGAATETGWRTTAVHETRNLAGDPARGFLIDPEAHFQLLRRLRGTNRAVIGCFHSHPGGTPHPSERDRAAAADDDFLWLIAGEGNLNAYVFDAVARRFVPVALNRSG